jgi:hypothetical protein
MSMKYRRVLDAAVEQALCVRDCELVPNQPGYTNGPKC